MEDPDADAAAVEAVQSEPVSSFWKILLIVVIILAIWALCTTVVLLSFLITSKPTHSTPLKLQTKPIQTYS